MCRCALQTEMVDKYKLDGVGVEADVVASNAGAPTSKNVSWLVSQPAQPCSGTRRQMLHLVSCCPAGLAWPGPLHGPWNLNPQTTKMTFLSLRSCNITDKAAAPSCKSSTHYDAAYLSPLSVFLIVNPMFP